MIKVGEPTNKYVEVWAFQIGNIPVNFIQWLFSKKGTKIAMELLSEQEGFVGFYPNRPYGTVCLFDSENNAKGAKNVLLFHNGKAGNIFSCYVLRGEME